MENKPERDVDIINKLEWECENWTNKIAETRRKYPAFLKKKDYYIAEMEALLLEREIKFLKKNTEPERIKRYNTDITLTNDQFNIKTIDPNTISEISEEYYTLKKIMKQIQNDTIHILTREPIDSIDILNKVRLIQTKNVDI